MKTSLRCCWLLWAFLSIQLSTKAQTFILNTAFGNNGITQVPLQNFDGLTSGSTLLQGNKILSSAITYADEYDYSGIISRLNADGRIDSSFGNNGYLYVCNDYYACYLAKYTLQPDGKIVTLSGTLPHYDYPIEQLWLERFLPNGQHDFAFGTNGAVVIKRSNRFGYLDVSPRSLVIKPDGKIVISTFRNDVFYIAQFLKNGNPDTTFGNKGIITSTTPYDGNITNVIALANNKLLAAGTYKKSDRTSGTDLIMYTANGKIDSAFAANGVALLGNTNVNAGNATELIIQNNKLLVYTEDAGKNVVYRCLSNGSIDNSFGTSGKVYADSVHGSVTRIIKLQPNNKIVINYTASLKLERLLPDGAVDNTFGSGGLLNVALANSNAFDVNKDYLVVEGGGYDYIHHYPVMQVASYISCSSCKVVAATENVIAKPGDIKICVYPNPARNLVYISGLSDKAVSHLTLSDDAGKVIQRASTTNANYTWNISNLQTGIYFIQVETGDAKEYSIKIMKE